LEEFREPTTMSRPVLRGVADIVAGRVEQLREALAQRGHGLVRLVDRERGLRQPGHLPPVTNLDGVAALGPVNQVNVPRGLTGGADDLLVALVPDQQDVVSLGGEPPGLVMHLGDQRAGGIDRAQPALGCLLAHLRGDPVRGENHHRALRDLLGLLDEDRTALLERADHVSVVHNLLADVDGSAKALQRLLDGLHRPVYARAVTTGLREQDASGGHGHDTHRR
jgi:hypothetical protein